MELGVASSRWVSTMSNLSVQRQRMLLGAGAAAGVAAGFNAPIAGIFFALEIVKVRTVGTCRQISRGQVLLVGLICVWKYFFCKCAAVSDVLCSFLSCGHHYYWCVLATAVIGLEGGVEGAGVCA